MPFCPKCRAEYRPEIARCAECEVSLVAELPALDAGRPLAEVASFATPAEADMLKELLEENGLDAVVQGDIDPIGIGTGAAPIKVFVEEDDLARATEIADEYFTGPSSGGDAEAAADAAEAADEVEHKDDPDRESDDEVQ